MRIRMGEDLDMKALEKEYEEKIKNDEKLEEEPSLFILLKGEVQVIPKDSDIV